MRVAVAGSTGVLGRALIPQLREAGYDVRALSRSGGFDILTATPDALAGCDVVIHAVTAIPRDFNAPGAWDANTRVRTEGTARLLAASIAAGVKGYIQQSIVMAYPDRGDDWIDEATPLDPAVHPPVHDMEAQVLAADALATCILRGGIFVGPRTFQDDAVARVREGREPILCGGRHFLPLVHVDDVAAAFVLAVERAPDKAIYNVNAEPIRQRDYVMGLAARLNAPAPPESATPCPPSHRCATNKARREIGWIPRREVWPVV